MHLGSFLMETSDQIALGALILSALAAVGSVIGFMVNRRDVRRSRRDAHAAAERADSAVDEARRAADAQERIAETFSDMLSRAEKRDQRQWSQAISPDRLTHAGNPYMGPGGSLPGPPTQVHWTVDRIKGKRFSLRNLGTGTARNVRLLAENTVRFDGPEGPLTIEGHSGDTSFLAIGSWQTGTPELVVTWTDDQGDHEWRRVLP